MEKRGLLPKSMEFIEYFKEHLPNGVYQYIPDLSGPLSFTNYLFGNDSFWMDFYDDTDFIRNAIDFARKVHDYMGNIYKQAIGETGKFSYNGPLFIPGNGVKVVDDSNVLLSPVLYRQFVADSVGQCFENFGTGWYHSCGHYPDKLDILLDMPYLRAINFGNPEMWDQDDVVARIVRSGKIYYGAWCRKPGESMEDYLRRAIIAAGPGKKGMIIFLHETHGQALPHPEEIMELWHKLQDAGF